MTRDTIVAVATPPGRGGVVVVRVSGPLVAGFAEQLLGKQPAPRQAVFARWHDVHGELIDFGLALYFAAPASFTGEDVLELQGHGGPVILEALVDRLVQMGARRARAGEFSERAYLNDKIDLTQAEAIADLIDAGSRGAARAALRSLQGDFAAQVNTLTQALIELRVYVEAAIDFSEEEIDFLSSDELQHRLNEVETKLQALERGARQGRLLNEGIRVAIAGAPNAGKSTLLNRLAGHEAAIVTPVAGTTRDVLRERILVDDLPIHIVDTAGLRDPATTADAIEQEGMRRARSEFAQADHLLFVIDSAADPAGQSYLQEKARLPSDVPVTLVFNKSDLVDLQRIAAAHSLAADGAPILHIAAATGLGMDALRTHLKQVAGYVEEGSGAISARARHLESLARCRAYFDAARDQLARRQGELVAEELRGAQQVLGEITGEFTSDDLLGRIFGSFCIGK
jgi:tRNA modification GTPase